METYNILRDLAIIFICAKGAGLLARKCKAPMVVGEIIAGLIIGPCLLNWVTPNDFVAQMAEIGVILIMFSAGLETNLQELKKLYKKDSKAPVLIDVRNIYSRQEAEKLGFVYWSL